jgi:hypothetical protein
MKQHYTTTKHTKEFIFKAKTQTKFWLVVQLLLLTY